VVLQEQPSALRSAMLTSLLGPAVIKTLPPVPGSDSTQVICSVWPCCSTAAVSGTWGFATGIQCCQAGQPACMPLIPSTVELTGSKDCNKVPLSVSHNRRVQSSPATTRRPSWQNAAAEASDLFSRHAVCFSRLTRLSCDPICLCRPRCPRSLLRSSWSMTMQHQYMVVPGLAPAP
jgi:hypothetical protein